MSNKEKNTKKHAFSSKIYFFTDTIINIDEISSKIEEFYDLKSKIYLNDVSTDDKKVCYTIYTLNPINKDNFQNFSLLLESIIKIYTKKQITLFYKDLTINNSFSYDLKYHIKGCEVKQKFSFINDD
jgi:hypothetical protein